jgi:cell division protein FtsQ
MAAVRARRPGRMRRAPQAPVHAEIPRLARIKLSGGLSRDDVQVSGKSLALALTGVVLFIGAAIAGAAWLGSSLFDARLAFARTADIAAADVGFQIGDIQIDGVSEARAAEVRAVINPDGVLSVLSLDPQIVKARVESLDWVQSVQVRRLWPSKLVVHVERRQAYARWREDGHVSVIDANGERLLAERASDHPELPLLIGAGAGPAAEPLLVALEDLPQLRQRLKALVRIGDRRWNVELNSGTTIALPEDNAPVALAQLETLQTEHALLDRPLSALDMRAPGLLAVRVEPQLAGGRHPRLGGV